jgi:predicted MFS family arabinose efflux permease
MNSQTSMTATVISQDRASWSAVFALSLCVATLVASEFMPVSLLTPIAADLHLTEGQAGQTIAVSGVFAVLTSLFISVLMAGRALVGVAIGGFWSLSAATVMRLVPAADVPRGLAILNGVRPPAACCSTMAGMKSPSLSAPRCCAGAR